MVANCWRLGSSKVDQMSKQGIKPAAGERSARSPGDEAESRQSLRRLKSGLGKLTPYVFMAPYLILFVGFVVIPSGFGIWISLHDWDYFVPNKPWVGLENYTDLFRGDSIAARSFWESMRATAEFTLYSVPFLITVPLLIAMFLNQDYPGRTFFRAVYFAPYVLGIAVVGVLWRYLLSANVGLVNHYMGVLGLPNDTAWLTSLPWAWVSLVAVTVWWTLGFNAVIYLAGLQDIPQDLYDAAMLDGANQWHKFRDVTLPGLRPVLWFVVTWTILASANMFGQSYVMTSGAPSNETRTAIMYITDRGLRTYDMGGAAAMSYVLTAVLILVSIVNFKIFRRMED